MTPIESVQSGARTRSQVQSEAESALFPLETLIHIFWSGENEIGKKLNLYVFWEK